MTGHLDRPAGVIMLGMLAASLLYYIRGGHAPGGDQALEAEIPEVPRPGLLWPIAQSVMGLLLLVGGAHLLVGAAEDIALAFGISQEVIGATMVAVGTSLPELAASVVAVVRGHHEIGIGNIIGSNQMNLLFVLGGVCLFGDVEAADQVRRVIVPITLVFTFALIPMMRTGGRVGRGEGALLLGGYAAFAAISYF
jgi:cation:H+ antiporter